MECKEFTSLIHDFIHDRLDEIKLSECLEHVQECDDCRDELRIQYLIYEGLERLEAGDTFDVDKDLAHLMEQQKTLLTMRRGVEKTAIAFEIITTAAFLIVVSVILFYH